MDVKMTLANAKEKAKEKLGPQGWAVRDPVSSNPTVRREARKNTQDFVSVLKDKNAPAETRRAIELALPYQQYLCNYYRYKIGVLDEELGIEAFTVYMHGDTFEKCFEKLEKLQQEDAKNEKPNTGNTEPDDDAPIPN